MERVKIASGFIKQPNWKIYLGVPLIYVPLIVTVPFVVLGMLLIRTHLKWIGGMDFRPYRDFIPSWASHRYCYDNQITYSTGSAWYSLRAYRFYWIFNCKLYCPLSVGLFRYVAYLVTIVENWWCPFDHDKKDDYSVAAVDRSYWHINSAERDKLHPDDLNNPVWNEDAQASGDITVSESGK
ncbi:MAG: hypothetical protein WBN96_00550 [Gammaproteobacteria bacterium]